jgi:Permuted papain-like amidase enzyme, YaeF/YiiX, C92 family
MSGILGWIVALLLNPPHEAEMSERLVPPGFQGNYYGPEATKARQEGRMAPIVVTPHMARWEQWGRQHLKTGDVVFRMGDARLAHGYFRISRFLAKCSNSQFSHTGIASIEEDGIVVYDTTRTGVARQPFCVWVLDNVGDFGVKRVKPEHNDAIPKVMAYLHKVYEEQLPFDYELSDDDTALYCVEMTEKAYRAAGLKLSNPVRLGDMERATEFPLPLLVLAFASRYQLKHPLTPDSLVYFPGNDRHGIWSAKQLMTVVPPTWAPGYPSNTEKAPAGRGGSTAKKPVEAKKVATPSVSPGTSRSPGQDRSKTSRTTNGVEPKTVRTGAGVVPQRN